MPVTITVDCPSCRKSMTLPLKEGEILRCPECNAQAGQIPALENIFSSCPVCQCRQFYIQKDFNRGLGCLIVLIGILLVPLTYGLSLPLFAGIDWLIYRRYPAMVICYKCAAEYRGLPAPKGLKSFLHHIGLKYDKYR